MTTTQCVYGCQDFADIESKCHVCKLESIEVRDLRCTICGRWYVARSACGANYIPNCDCEHNASFERRNDSRE